MKKIIFIGLSIFILGIFFISCSGNKSKDGNADGLIGKWEITEAQGSMADLNKGTIYDFVDATNIKVVKGGMETKVTYKQSGDTLIWSYGPGFDLKAIIKINGNKMDLQSLTSDQKWVLMKK